MKQAPNSPFHSVVEENLVQSERVIYRGKLDSIVYIPQVIVTCMGLLIMLQSPKAGFFWGGLAFAAAVKGWLEYKISEFVVTNQRVSVRTNILNVEVDEILLGKIESISVKSFPILQLSDFGTVQINGSGGKSLLIKKLARPQQFKKHIQEQIELQKKTGGQA